MTLDDVADQIEAGMKWRSVCPSFHACCHPVDGGYADRVGRVFAALRAETGTSQTYLGDVLKHQFKEGVLAQTVRSAANRMGAEDE